MPRVVAILSRIVCAGLAALTMAAMMIPGAGAADLVVRVKAPEMPGDVRDDYYRDVLGLALDETRAEGTWRIDIGVGANQTRAMRMLDAGQLDVVWLPPTTEREATMRPVRIPLEKGLLGYRVLIIRAADRARFAAITGADQLKGLFAGQGHDWVSTRVMEANGYNVTTETNIDTLFAALKAGRFDYFPRGLNEAWAELASRPDEGLIVEPTLLLVYPTTVYFFVRKDATALAGRLERGLRMALTDGRLDRMLIDHPSHREALRVAAIGKRKVFRLTNPLMVDDAPGLEDAAWRLPARLLDPAVPAP